MGYSHYWTFLKNDPKTQQAYKRALIDCVKIVKASPVSLAGWDGTGTPELDKGISFNGVNRGSCETFCLPDEIPAVKGERIPGVPAGFNFCKTRLFAYDVVVVACLCVLQDTLGDAVEVTSNGSALDWENGQALACKALGRIGRSIPIPAKVRSNSD